MDPGTYERQRVSVAAQYSIAGAIVSRKEERFKLCGQQQTCWYTRGNGVVTPQPIVHDAPSVALDGLLRVRLTVSLLSCRVSLRIGTLALRVVTPVAKVSVPLLAV